VFCFSQGSDTVKRRGRVLVILFLRRRVLLVLPCGLRQSDVVSLFVA
jgi:hypothetical protein